MQKKLIIAVLLNVILISATLGIISYFAVHESINRSLQSRLALARIISNYVEVFLNNNLYRLKDISLSGKLNLKDHDWRPEKRMLETVYKYSLFTEGVFLLDKHGNELLTYPPHVDYFSNLTYITYVNQVLQTGKIETNSYIEIIDANEIVVASDNPLRVFQHHAHDSTLSKMITEGKDGIMECRHGFSHPDAVKRPVDRLAFVPLSVAKWGVIVGQAEEDIFAPASGLEKKFLFLVFIFIGTSIIFSIGMSLNIVRPVRSLIASTNKIASGDLSTPVGNLGSDEILTLSNSFDDMRQKLAESLESIKNQNVELENRVVIRTKQIRESRQKIEDLLKRLISSQEEERKRIARGLHDTILQDTSAFLIKLDICRLHPERVTVGKIDEMRKIAMETIDNIHLVIKDLRPSILDDLGLDAAIMWLLTNHLHEKGIRYYLDVESPLKMRLPPKVEITIFRILQEAIINIARHANAESVMVTFDAGDNYLLIIIEDDGDGFDVDELMKHPIEGGRGLGITGMKERASLVNGILQVYSVPGEGTRVCIQVPLKDQVEHV